MVVVATLATDVPARLSVPSGKMPRALAVPTGVTGMTADAVPISTVAPVSAPGGAKYSAVPPNTLIAVTLVGLARDRKSTRLNSSHGYISYAVFCLKKKKK